MFACMYVCITYGKYILLNEHGYTISLYKTIEYNLTQ